MKTKNKVFAIIISILSLSSIASLSYLFVSHAIDKDNNNIEVISFTSLDSPLSLSYSFGTINPGENVNQSFKLTSKVIMDINYTVSFSSKDDSDIFSYIYVNTNFDENKVSLKSTFDYEYLSRKLESNKSEEITFNYLLDENLPDNLYGDFSFNVVFNAKV